MNVVTRQKSVKPLSPQIDLFSPVQYLKGVGPKRAALLRTVGIVSIEDLLYYIPRRYLDRRLLAPISHIKVNTEATVVGQVETFGFTEGRRPRFVVILNDGTGMLQCVWFQGAHFVQKAFHVGDTVVVSGPVRFYRGKQMTHPEFEILSNSHGGDLLHTGRIIPLYPSTAELKARYLDSRGFRRIIKPALDRFLKLVPETLPESIRERCHLLPLCEAVRGIHFPETMDGAEKARQRLDFDELFYLELMLARRKRKWTEAQDGIAFKKVGEKVRELLDLLSFELTEAQKRVVKEIWSDMKSKRSMNRLLQGDVGSGKTVVALIAILIAVENGYQAALMAPTEILAEQHYLTVRHVLKDLGVTVILLVGSMRKSSRQKALEAIGKGEAEVIIGTHALIQEDVAIGRLGLVIIDEQHRFGVQQRAILREKGLQPDVLVMTATPIPRTLALTVYGDLDVSVIDEMPPGRKEVKTVWKSDQHRDEIYSFLRDQVRNGGQVYIVYPLVEESEKIDLKAAKESYEHLRSEIFFDLRMALIHGQMGSEAKDRVMALFKAGGIDILVSTTVIEVGVDVPNATVMIIEHAERFGLSQLHQLRGRVGRGPRQSYCILLARYPISEEAKQRLRAIRGSTDGFKIAEADLKLRGPGEFFGTRQHGMPELKIANMITDASLLSAARREAFSTVEQDPELKASENTIIRRTFETKYKGKFELVDVG
ncbi:MAG: ATP-dependent DNA helicase RecG [Gemmatimonadota bacterium]|nr:MAG: ATP-dependent DNA helicase RecG [Gemmatimonadota bacterium]